MDFFLAHTWKPWRLRTGWDFAESARRPRRATGEPQLGAGGGLILLIGVGGNTDRHRHEHIGIAR